MKTTLESLPYGTVFKYRHRLCVKSKGLDGDIICFPREGGNWSFVRDLKWKSFVVLFSPQDFMFRGSKKF